MKTLKDYQNEVKKLTKKFNFDWSNYVQYIHLIEEVGELGEALTVYKGDRKAGTGKKALADHCNLEEEFGDILFTLLELGNQLNFDLAITLEKTFERYNRKLNKLKEVPDKY